MRCTQMQRLLDQYYDNELTESWRSACKQHLSACADCRQALVDLRLVSGTLRDWECCEGSDELTASVLAAWQAHRPKLERAAVRRRRAERTALAAGVAAAMSAAGFAAVQIERSLPVSPVGPSLIAQASEAWLKELLWDLGPDADWQSEQGDSSSRRRSSLRLRGEGFV